VVEWVATEPVPTTTVMQHSFERRARPDY